MVNEKRLIDANALVDLVLNHPRPYRRDFYAMISNAPTVDAVEVVHGRWVNEYPYVRCSECNAEWFNSRTDNEPMLFYFCPNCGAKMDGDGNG